MRQKKKKEKRKREQVRQEKQNRNEGTMVKMGARGFYKIVIQPILKD